MKRIILIVIALLVAFAVACPVSATTKTNKQIAKEWAKATYNGKVIKVVDKVPKNRNGKVYIERIPTTSQGGYKGKTKDGFSVKYARKVRKGKKEICYAVYNPNNNYCDDVVCFVSCKVVKADKVTHKAKAVSGVECPNCDGSSHDCPYWTGDRHMTEQEIKEFEWLEWHYLADDGQWYELRTGNTEPVEKPDYVTRW